MVGAEFYAKLANQPKKTWIITACGLFMSLSKIEAKDTK